MAAHREREGAAPAQPRVAGPAICSDSNCDSPRGLVRRPARGCAVTAPVTDRRRKRLRRTRAASLLAPGKSAGRRHDPRTPLGFFAADRCRGGLVAHLPVRAMRAVGAPQDRLGEGTEWPPWRARKGSFRGIASFGRRHLAQPIDHSPMCDDWKVRIANIVQQVPADKAIEYRQLADLAGVAKTYCRAFPRVLSQLPPDVAMRAQPSGAVPAERRWAGDELFDVRPKFGA